MLVQRWPQADIHISCKSAASTGYPLDHAFVYVGNADSNDINVLSLDSKNGELAAIERVPIPGLTETGATTPMAVSPDRRVLYVASRGEPLSVSSFSINPASGKLTYL